MSESLSSPLRGCNVVLEEVVVVVCNAIVLTVEDNVVD
jgi:hypothetical protein